jgi:hypothetical protein
VKPTLLAAAALATVVLPPGAEAHYATGKQGYRSRILAVEPHEAGLELKILYGDDQVWLDNKTGKTIVIRGYGGEPYLRFGRDGISINGNSPAVYLNQDRFAKAAVPKSASPKAKPKWEKLAGGDAWAWHDHRIHYMSPTPPKAVQEAPGRPHHLFDWKVPATANGKPFSIAGSLDYKPPPQDDGFPVELAIALATLTAVGMVGLFALRRVLLRSLE